MIHADRSIRGLYPAGVVAGAWYPVPPPSGGRCATQPRVRDVTPAREACPVSPGALHAKPCRGGDVHLVQATLAPAHVERGDILREHPVERREVRARSTPVPALPTAR